jgi:hypothetical protein
MNSPFMGAVEKVAGGRLKGHLSLSTFLSYNDKTMFCVN